MNLWTLQQAALNYSIGSETPKRYKYKVIDKFETIFQYVDYQSWCIVHDSKFKTKSIVMF